MTESELRAAFEKAWTLEITNWMHRMQGLYVEVDLAWIAYQAGHRRAQEWLPMESAPRDCDILQPLEHHGHGGTNHLCWVGWADEANEPSTVLGWLPLPPLPEGKHT